MNGIFKLAKVSAAICLVVLGASPVFAADMSKFAAELNRIEDRLAIEAAWARYPDAIDTADADAYAALFTQDGVMVCCGQTVRGREAIRQFIADFRNRSKFDQLPPEADGRRFSPVRHVVTSLNLQIDGNTAASESYWMEIMDNGKDKDGVGNLPSVLNMGRYEDQWVKQDGKWLIKKRVVVHGLGPGAARRATKPR
ncbi:MAG TPA: nuclear transport factor 2 family protein [Steroidobacteraceae bacterium]|nr:nuclear transport factor 2 family protein [Steroidobacteraceae bacterium]